MIDFIISTNLLFILIIAIVMVFEDNLKNLMLYSTFLSILSTTLYNMLNAPDVGITEICVGTGIGTIITVMALNILNIHLRVEDSKSMANYNLQRVLLLLLFVLIAVSMSIIISFNISTIGDQNNISNIRMTGWFYKTTIETIGIPNVVTAILASFRGYDTLGETIVIFIAGMSVYILLKEK